MPSLKNIEQVKKLSESFEKAKAIYFTEYHGLDVKQVTRLRSMFFKENIDFKVAKNTLIKIVLKDAKINDLDKLYCDSC